jgi:hypothetical protein
MYANRAHPYSRCIQRFIVKGNGVLPDEKWEKRFERKSDILWGYRCVEDPSSLQLEQAWRHQCRGLQALYIQPIPIRAFSLKCPWS